MTIKRFIARMKTKGKNQTQEVHAEIAMVKQRLSELGAQGSPCGEKEEKRGEGSLTIGE